MSQESYTLEYHNDAKNSHKFYEVEIDGREVSLAWGRVNTTGQQQFKTFASGFEAREFAHKKLTSKLREGYVEVRHDNGTAVTAQIAPKPTIVVPPPTFGAQLAEPIEMDQIGDFIIDDDWVIEQKLDGHRLLLKGTGHGVEPFNRNGQPYAGKTLPPQLAGMKLPDGLILDGELLDLNTLEYWAFDFRAADGSIDAQPLTVRRDMLRLTLEQLQLPVRLLPQADTTVSKETLVRKAIENNAEGVVVKYVDAGYKEGRGTGWRKLKFVSSCEVIVTGVRDDGKDSATLSLLRGTDLVEVGRCSLIGREPVNVGDIIEAKYLYATSDDRLYQPVMVRRRTDKKHAECTIDQLRYTDRSIITL